MPNRERQVDVAELWRFLDRDPTTVLLEGFHATKHALRFGADVLLIVSANKRGVLALAKSLASDLTDTLEAEVVEIPESLYRELVPRPHPTATAAWARRPAYSYSASVDRTASRSSPVVLLDNPRDHGNVGAVIRLAAGMGCSAVLTTGDLDPWHPQVIRGSAGLHFAIPVSRIDIESLPGGPLLALDPEGEDLRGATIPDNAIIAFGSERRGISAEIRQRADKLLAIPMRPKVSSYNLATSVAMTLYHWTLHAQFRY